MLRQKLETAEAAGKTGVEIGTGHLRLLLDCLDVADPFTFFNPQPTGTRPSGSTSAPHPVGTNR
jgi:hypothetical protein